LQNSLAWPAPRKPRATFVDKRSKSLHFHVGPSEWQLRRFGASSLSQQRCPAPVFLSQMAIARGLYLGLLRRATVAQGKNLAIIGFVLIQSFFVFEARAL